jgi:hypothetical protein
MILGEIHLPAPPEWMSQGPCAQADPEAWFPERGGSTKEAKRVCWTSCPVREECLQFALDRDERFGIYGGYSERERRRIKRGETVKPFIKPAPKSVDCKQCAEPFTPKHHSQTFCSRGCARANEAGRVAARKRKLRACLQCGHEFESSYSTYCSKECRVQARLSKPPEVLGTSVCDWCGEDYEPVHHLQRYCSEEHQHESRKVQWRKARRALRRTEVSA